MTRPLIVFALMLISCTAYGDNFKDDYASAANKSLKEHQLLIVVVTSQGCPPCERMKRDSLTMEKEGYFIDKNICFVDYKSEIAKKLGAAGMTPEIFAFKYVEGKWIKTKILGYSDTNKFKEFLDA